MAVFRQAACRHTLATLPSYFMLSKIASKSPVTCRVLLYPFWTQGACAPYAALLLLVSNRLHRRYPPPSSRPDIRDSAPHLWAAERSDVLEIAILLLYRVTPRYLSTQGKAKKEGGFRW